MTYMLTYDTVRLDLMGLRDMGTSVSDNLSTWPIQRAGRYELDSGKSTTDSVEMKSRLTTGRRDPCEVMFTVARARRTGIFCELTAQMLTFCVIGKIEGGVKIVDQASGTDILPVVRVSLAGHGSEEEHDVIIPNNRHLFRTGRSLSPKRDLGGPIHQQMRGSG